jgi:hypothetical protein
MSDFEIGYVMGLFVGEGCSTSYPSAKGRAYPFCSLRLHARDPEPLKTLQRLLGGKVFGPYRDGKRISRIWILRGAPHRSALWLFFQYLPESHKRQQLLDWLHEHELHLLYPRQKSPTLPPSPSTLDRLSTATSIDT